MASDEKYVTFLDSAGNEISNDPRWQAERILGIQKQDGVDPRDAELEELRAFKAAHQVATGPNVTATDSDEEEEEEDDTPDAENPYAEVKGQALVDLARERGVDLKAADGTKLKAAQVREALAAQDVGRASA